MKVITAEGIIIANYEANQPKPWLLYSFPERKKELSKLNYDQKMEWYATRDRESMIFLGNSKEFQRFWKWHVLIPMKLKRLYYRIKNGEVFKHYAHITEMKAKVKKHSI